MALDVLAGEIVTLTRDQWRDRYLRSYKVRLPNADTSPDSMPWIDASCIADQLVILSENARRNGAAIPLSGKTGDTLAEAGSDVGLTRAPATGGSGFVSIRTSAGGATYANGAELSDPATGLRFTFTGATATYTTGDQLAITASSTGPSTNLAGGTVLQWSSPPAGSFPTATVVTQPDGSGLKGGADVEDDDTFRDRIRARLANGAASGNDAAYQALIEDTVEHGVAVAKAFTYPAIVGPGSIGCVFLLVANGPNSSRIPSSGQISTVQGFVTARAADALPADDSSIWPAVTEQETTIILRVEWSGASHGWADLSPWPPYYATNHAPGAPGGIVIDGSTTPTATVFKVKTDNADYTSVVQPVIGQTVGLFDPSSGIWYRKRILSFTGTGPWTITVDTSNSASDTSYTPVVGQRVSPWSDSLANVSPPVSGYFETLGPGEMTATLPDPGLRMRRNPVSPKDWPSVITNHLVVSVLDVPDVNDATVTEGLGTETTAGDTTQVYQQILGDLGVFAA